MATRDTTPPVVNITSPVNGTQYLADTNITITATGNDGKGVTLMKLFVIVPGSTTRQQIASASFAAKANTVRTITTTYTINIVGNYSIIAEAYDAASNLASKQIYVTRATSTTSTTTTVAPPPSLPSSKILNTPTPWYQGSEGSCVSMSTALLMSIEKYYTTGATSYSQSTNELSPEWLYNYCLCGTNPLSPLSTCGQCGGGSGTLQNFDLTYTKGVPRWSVCPYSFQNGCVISGFTQTMTDDAALSKSTYYASTPSIDVYTMKRLLCNNHALLFNYNYDDNYYNAPNDPNYVWRTSSGTFNGSPGLSASHASAIIGYDDSKNAWLIQNSWGTAWAWGGKIWVDIDAFASGSFSASRNVWFLTTRVDKNYFPIL